MGNASSRADSDSSKSEDIDTLINRIKEARRRKSDSYTMDTRGIDVDHTGETDANDVGDKSSEWLQQQVMRPSKLEMDKISSTLNSFDHEIDRSESSCSSVDSTEYHIVDPKREISKNKIV